MEVTGEVAAPRDAIEQMLVQIWCKILNMQRIGVNDNFFELGGHSLLAVRIVAEIERTRQEASAPGHLSTSTDRRRPGRCAAKRRLEADRGLRLHP